MTKRMLVDATHAEETRVALVDGNRLVDYDYESKVRKQLKGSIFLAKVTRVEPSLQAAFVNFGGNRHGFLPFSEIHPDYYRIPIADREAILAEQERELAAQEEADEEEYEEEADEEAESAIGEDEEDEEDEVEEVGGDLAVAEDENGNGNGAEEAKDDGGREREDRESRDAREGRRGGRRRRGGRDRRAARSRRVETVGGDTYDDTPVRPSIRRNYKIQEVIKRGQIMLIQVSKEERGNKGAAVTTYLSLPGRYCVLMPNSARAGGVSRKIDNYKERRRMREILDDLQVPEGMSIIMRTAGVSRNKTEIKRDLDYLTRLWDNIRDLTLKSTAPALIHEEGNLIRRSIRDIYTRDVEEILVAGDEGYKLAREFMKMIIPSHTKRVKQYKGEKIPLFHRFQVESQISEIGDSIVTLPAGGYIVISPTEALVSIDVNSGRATKGRHIEETALRTNQEAAEEVARQLRLRDLGGLVVIDFIDMEDRRNNRRVEARFKDALSSDRARIQVGRISSFGLLELSRQRLNPSLTEAQFEKCPHCKGTGVIRTTDSAAIIALRALEDEGIRGRAEKISLHVPNEVALYILNNKRDMVEDIERRYGFSIAVDVDESLAPASFKIEILAQPVKSSEEGEGEEISAAVKAGEEGDQEGRRGRGRRRGRRGGRRRNRDRDHAPADGRERDSGDIAGETEDAAGLVEKPALKDKDQAPAEDKEADRKQEKKEPRGRRGRGHGRRRDAESEKAPQAEAVDGAKKESPARPEEAGVGKHAAPETPSGKEEKPEAAAPQPPASNDVKPAPKHEKVNEPPVKKKRGWWSKGT